MATEERSPITIERLMSEPFPGVRLGPHKVNNQQLADDLSKQRNNGNKIENLPELIKQRTGIEYRHLMQPVDQEPASHNETVPKMAKEIAKAEISRTGWRTHDVDRIVFFSTYPLASQENIGTIIAQELDAINTPLITQDIYSACSGSAVALAYVGKVSHYGQRILLVGAEHYSANMNPTDLNRSIFSDGGVAAAFRYGIDLEVVDMTELFHQDSDAIKAPVGIAPLGSISHSVPYAPKFEMNGRQVKEWVLNGEPVEQALELYKRANKGKNAVYLISHQASGTTLDEYFARLRHGGVPESALPAPHVSQIGNLAAASALAETRALAHETKLKKGDSIIIEAYGAGLTAQGVTLKVLVDNPFRPAY